MRIFLLTLMLLATTAQAGQRTYTSCDDMVTDLHAYDDVVWQLDVRLQHMRWTMDGIKRQLTLQYDETQAPDVVLANDLTTQYNEMTHQYKEITRLRNIAFDDRAVLLEVYDQICKQ